MTNTNNALIQDLRNLNDQWEDAYDVWESLKGKARRLFEANELDTLRVKIYNLEQRILKGEVITVESKKEKELEKLEKQWDEATDVYCTLKGKKRLMFEENELNPLRVRIYNLKKELNK